MSSFFEDTKNAGTLLLIIGLIAVIVGIVSLFIGDKETWRKILGVVGCVIEGAIYVILGLDIRNGACRFQIGSFFSDVKSKYGVLLAILFANAAGTLVSGICTLAVFSIIVAVLLFVMCYFMVNGGKLAGNIIWIILLILFILEIIAGVLSIIVLVGIPILLLGILELVFLLSPEVKQKMGM